MKALREGFTTGSCAAAAALACCLWQRDGVCPERVRIVVPEGRAYAPVIAPHEGGRCGVIKDSGDDPDITGGMEVIAQVALGEGEGPISFRAGEGVGVVTQPGLKIPVGEAAINPVPRRTIEEAVRSVYGSRAACVTISIPGGEEVARKTFNPRLGIEGGLSVLGTSGVVRPMSEAALKESLVEELNMRVAQGHRFIIYTFGNQGEEAMRALFPGLPIVQVSNEIGFMLDAALERGVARVLLGGHPGKLAKVAAGVMQTHSHTADARREAIVTHLAFMGAPVEILRQIYEAVTTDTAIRLIDENGLNEVWDRLAESAWRYFSLRVRVEMELEII
ncbi:MAG: cobalamin biosynthesis protein CbiD, partial [Clostridia bacterium]|nr:cobalamin biosynthesis protein CbiD [Clostridia bacterium]